MGKGLKKTQKTVYQLTSSPLLPRILYSYPPPNCRGSEGCGRTYEAHFLVHWDPLTVWARHWRQELRWEDEGIFQPFSLFKWAQCSRHWTADRKRVLKGGKGHKALSDLRAQVLSLQLQIQSSRCSESHACQLPSTRLLLFSLVPDNRSSTVHWPQYALGKNGHAVPFLKSNKLMV